MICPLVKIEARLDHKHKVFKKHADIARILREEILIMESEKRFIYSMMMNSGRGAY